MSLQSGQIGCAVIGYGATHNFGKMHCIWIEDNPDLKLVAVCDRDPSRTAEAKKFFPSTKIYNNTIDLWKDSEVEMVTIVTPNFTQCPLTQEAFTNGRHVLVENTMCLSVAEASQMVEASERVGKMLCVHHNRRHDGNYRLIREIIDSGRIGEVFHIELTPGQYQHPFAGNTDVWWADKKRSGGGFFYYGAQAIDWILDLVPAKMVNVTGFCQKRVWTDMTFDDEVMAIIRFENGVYANFCESHIRAAPQPFWRILGTKGAIVDSGEGATKGYEKQVRHPSSGSLTLFTLTEKGIKEESLPYRDSDWDGFYQDIVRHLRADARVPVGGEVGRRVMSVLEAARKSCESGQAEVPAYK